MELTSTQNQKVKHLSNLQKNKQRNKYMQYVIYGEKLVKVALETEVVIEVYQLDTNLRVNVPSYKVSKQVMSKITGGAHTSIACLCKISESEFTTGNVLILDAIQDPGNLGTILRTAKACGIDNIFLGNGCADLYNEKVLRSMQGVNYMLNIRRGAISEYLQTDDKPVITTYLDMENKGFAKAPATFNIIFGNEGQGINPEYRQFSSHNIKLDISYESLNVGVAAGIIMYNLKERL